MFFSANVSIYIRNKKNYIMGRPKLDKSDWVCCVCGEKYGEHTTKFRRINGKIYCSKHSTQIERYGKILPHERERNRIGPCCICGKPGRCTWTVDGRDYCKKHYLQVYRHGRVYERTIYDGNEYIDHIEEGYTECVMYDKAFKEVGRTIVDLDKKPILEKYKIHMRTASNKKYALINLGGGQKLLLHRFILGITDRNYTVERCVDHINGDSLDNRISNLRICSQNENMKNIKKGDKYVCGVKWLRENQKWGVCITYNYASIHVGNFENFEEAVYARIKKEKELFGEYGANSKYYYILNSENPIEEIKKIGFIKQKELERTIPLIESPHKRDSVAGKKILEDLNKKQKEND